MFRGPQGRAALIAVVVSGLAGAHGCGRGTSDTSTRLRIGLDFTVSGYHAPWFVAQEEGFFLDEGLDVVINRGFGSGETGWIQGVVATPQGGVAMEPSRPRRSDRALRRPMRSPGRPPAGRREHRQRFWEEVARGLTSEKSAVAAGVSPAVGTRWFRECGGMLLAAAPNCT